MFAGIGANERDKVLQPLLDSQCFTGSEKAISNHARNKESLDASGEEEYDEIFPIYFSCLEESLYPKVSKQILRNEAAKSPSDIVNFYDLSHPVLKIISFMTEEDLKLLET